MVVSCTQIIVVSHAPGLLVALDEAGTVRRITLEKRLGETIIEDDDPPAWVWPAR